MTTRDSDRLDRVQVALEAIRSDWRTYFAILAAAPDQDARIAGTVEYFQVDEEIAAIALDQPLKWFLGQADEKSRPFR